MPECFHFFLCMVILTFLQCLIRVTDLWIIVLNAAVKGSPPFFCKRDRCCQLCGEINRTFASLRAVFPLWQFQFKYPFWHFWSVPVLIRPTSWIFIVAQNFFAPTLDSSTPRLLDSTEPYPFSAVRWERQTVHYVNVRRSPLQHSVQKADKYPSALDNLQSFMCHLRGLCYFTVWGGHPLILMKGTSEADWKTVWKILKLHMTISRNLPKCLHACVRVFVCMRWCVWEKKWISSSCQASSMPFISGISPAAASKTLQACAASPGLIVDPDSQNHAVDGALQTLCGVKRRLPFLIQTAAALRSVDVVWICNGRRVGDGPTAVLRGCLLPAAVSHILWSRTTAWTRWQRLIGLWSLSPGASSLPDLLEILKTELCPCTPLHSDSPDGT